MEANEKTIVMVETAQSLKDMVQKRMANRMTALTTLQTSPMESLPDDVKQMREIEASRIRAVMQEQSDLIEIIEMLFPQAAAAKSKLSK